MCNLVYSNCCEIYILVYSNCHEMCNLVYSNCYEICILVYGNGCEICILVYSICYEIYILVYSNCFKDYILAYGSCCKICILAYSNCHKIYILVYTNCYEIYTLVCGNCYEIYIPVLGSYCKKLYVSITLVYSNYCEKVYLKVHSNCCVYWTCHCKQICQKLCFFQPDPLLYLGLPSTRRLCCYPQSRVSMSLPCTAWRRHSGCTVSSPKYLEASKKWWSSSGTTKPRLHLHATTSTTHTWSTSTCATTGFAGWLNRVPCTLCIVWQMTWLPMHSLSHCPQLR